MRFSRVLISIMILCSVAIAASRKSVYRNMDYGIFLHVPPGAWLCPYPGGSDHGPAMLLGSEDSINCRSDLRQKRWMIIFGEYNNGEDLHTFLNRLCAYISFHSNDPSAVCSSAPADLSVKGLLGEAARINHSNGRIEIIVVAQAGKPYPDVDAAVPSFNYDMRLNTDARHFDEDVAVFRAVLKAVILVPPPLVPVNHP